jgi:hypothetical protein
MRQPIGSISGYDVARTEILTTEIVDTTHS